MAKGRKKKDYPQESIDNVIRLYSEGNAPGKISMVSGIGVATIKRIVKDAGIEIRTRKPKIVT